MLKTEKDIIQVIQTDRLMMEILHSVKHLDLPDWWICAGFVRSKIWDVQHGFEAATRLPDVDVIYFDTIDLSEEKEKEYEKRLHVIQPGIPWSVKNQARMHLANKVAPYESSEDAMSKYPETATALGVKLTEINELILAAPCGIEDVLQCKVKPTAYFAADEKRMQVYKHRVREKSWPQIWPKVNGMFLHNT